MIAVFGFRFIEPRDTTVQPTMRHFHGLLGIGILCIARSTLVKSHHDVCPDGTFNVHYSFRSENVFASVDVRTELSTFFTQLADTCQGKDLKTAAIGQHRTVEAVELVQSSGFFNNIQSGTQIKMIGIT